MRIKSVYVDGYRRFREETIRLENFSTVVAGANNSGKTSFVDLLRVVLNGESSFSADDLSAKQRIDWMGSLIDAAIESEEAYLKLIDGADFTHAAPSIEVRIEVAYDPKSDDIREFAQYLMDLVSQKNSFYFMYRFGVQRDALKTALEAFYILIQDSISKHGWSSFEGISLRSSPFLLLQAELDKILTTSSKAGAFFADDKYANVIPMESTKELSRLFNFRSVKAARTLDDASDDRSGALGARLMAVAKEDDRWAEVLKGFPEQVLAAIRDTGIGDITTKETLESLNRVVESISQTNGTAESDLFVDFQMNENHAAQLIARAMQTRYFGTGAPLGEGSQGLGYSNLIFLHLEAESFIRSASSAENSLLVNLIVLEEPESHMHPQMQNAFIKHLYERVAKTDNLQALVTTHSSEIIRLSEITQLRVLKSEQDSCRIIDLRQFHEEQVEGKSDETQRLFSFLYSINFSDVLFADKVVMYEGDTERMYIQALIAEREDLSQLRTQYISYVQVGGAYAHIYKPLIVDTLHLKTVIITDLDYEKDSVTTSLDEVRGLTTTNATLKHFFATEGGEDASAKVGDLFDQISDEYGIAVTGGDYPVGVAFQSDKEGCARTFEEAVLAGFLGKDVWASMTKADWTKFKVESTLKFSIPRDAPLSLRRVVASTASKKTDFMYSLLVKKDFKDAVPPYILAALKWLNA